MSIRQSRRSTAADILANEFPPRFMCSAHKHSDSCAKKRVPVLLLWAMAFGILVFTSTIGRTQNLLSNGSLTTSASSNSVLVIGASTTAISSWKTTLSTNSGANNYSLNGNQTTNPAIPNPPASALPLTFSVQLDSTSSGANGGSNNTLSYNTTVSLLAHSTYDLSFYLNSETGSSIAPANTSAASTLNLTGTGLAISSVAMVNAGSATGTHVATGFSNTISGTTVNLTAPTILSGSTSATQPWVKVDIIFTTTGAVTLPTGSILFTDLGSSGSNNSSVADFSLTQVVPEISDWRITAGFCVFCIALGSVGGRKRTDHRLILKTSGRP